MDRSMLDGDETPSDGLPATHKCYASMGLDDADDEVFEEEEDPSTPFHSRYDHRLHQPIELKVRKEISDTGYRGYIAPTPPVTQLADPAAEEILHKVKKTAYGLCRS